MPFKSECKTNAFTDKDKNKEFGPFRPSLKKY